MSDRAVHAEPVVRRAARTMPAARASVIAVVLAFAAGATDAFAFLQLGGVFTANMTGNLVLVGLVPRAGYASSVVGLLVAVVAFLLASYAAFRIAPAAAGRGRHAVLLVVGAVAQVAVLVCWSVGGGRDQVLVPLLIGLSAVAMATQTAFARRLEARSGVTTTYVTGTLTSLTADLADRKPQALLTRVGVVVALVAGALADAGLTTADARWAAALPVLPVGVALALLLSRDRERQDRSPTSAPRDTFLAP